MFSLSEQEIITIKMGEFQSVLSFAGLLAAFIIVTLMLGMQERKRSRSKLIRSLREGFGRPSSKKTSPERYAQIPQYYLHHRQGGEIDDITWNDLDLDDLYRVMDNTCSASGEEYLYSSDLMSAKYAKALANGAESREADE